MKEPCVANRDTWKLEDAGFDARQLKNAEFDVAQLKEAGQSHGLGDVMEHSGSLGSLVVSKCDPWFGN